MALFELSRPSFGGKWSGPIYKKLKSFILDEYEVFFYSVGSRWIYGAHKIFKNKCSYVPWTDQYIAVLNS